MCKDRSRVLKWRFVFAAGILLLATALSVSGDAPPDDWKAPPRFAKIKNPVPSDATSIDAGKQIYLANCMACHGMTGKGDGPAAISCNPRPKDLAEPQIASQADGELFWKITEGKNGMKPYRKLLTETQRWTVINYIRTLAPPPPSTAPSGG
jgi:mono/diheme cytochrome c family protein